MVVFLSKKGFMFRVKWNPRYQKYTKTKITDGKRNPLAYLGYKIELEDGFTLRSMFKLVENYPILQLIDNYYPAFLKEYKLCPEKGCTGDLMSVNMQRMAIYEHEEMYLSLDVIGYGKAEEGEHSFPDAHGNTRYGIDFSGLKDLLDLPIKLDKMLISEEQDKYSKKEKDVLMKKGKKGWDKLYRRVEYPTYYTLFELLHGIIWEISFYGVPAEREKQKDILKERVESIKDGTAETVPFDEVVKKLKKKYKKKKGKTK